MAAVAAANQPPIVQFVVTPRKPYLDTRDSVPWCIASPEDRYRGNEINARYVNGVFEDAVKFHTPQLGASPVFKRVTCGTVGAMAKHTNVDKVRDLVRRVMHAVDCVFSMRAMDIGNYVSNVLCHGCLYNKRLGCCVAEKVFEGADAQTLVVSELRMGYYSDTVPTVGFIVFIMFSSTSQTLLAYSRLGGEDTVTDDLKFVHGVVDVAVREHGRAFVMAGRAMNKVAGQIDPDAARLILGYAGLGPRALLRAQARRDADRGRDESRMTQQEREYKQIEEERRHRSAAPPQRAATFMALSAPDDGEVNGLD